MVKYGQVAIAGRVSGMWDKDARTFAVKRGLTKGGTKYQLFEIAVSAKDEDGSYKNGKGIKVMLLGDKKVEHKDVVGLLGFLVPDNYQTKDGKDVYGNMLMCKVEDMFEVAKKQTNTESTQAGKTRPSVEDVW